MRSVFMFVSKSYHCVEYLLSSSHLIVHQSFAGTFWLSSKLMYNSGQAGFEYFPALQMYSSSVLVWGFFWTFEIKHQ